MLRVVFLGISFVDFELAGRFPVEQFHVGDALFHLFSELVEVSSAGGHRLLHRVNRGIVLFGHFGKLGVDVRIGNNYLVGLDFVSEEPFDNQAIDCLGAQSRPVHVGHACRGAHHLELLDNGGINICLGDGNAIHRDGNVSVSRCIRGLRLGSRRIGVRAGGVQSRQADQ